MQPIFFVLILPSCLLVSVVDGWGATGHSLVAQIAQTLLSSEAQQFVRAHLAWYVNGNMSMVASWADTILYPDTDPDYLNWQWSKELHYVNTPDWSCTYDRDRDCAWTGTKTCIDGSIQNYTGRLADTSKDHVQRLQALQFLIHFIGDVHQPLHGGFAGDKGGNSIRGRFFGKSTNLHSLWDTGMIQRRISLDFRNNPSQYYAYLLNLMSTTYATNISQWTKCPSSDQSHYLACSAAWIVEDAELNCALVYRDEQDKPMNMSVQFDLSQTYYNTRMIAVERRLLQSGVRLAAVINKIVQANKHHHHPKENLCPATMLLYMIICFEIVLAVVYLTYRLLRRIFDRGSPLADTPPQKEPYHSSYSTKA